MLQFLSPSGTYHEYSFFLRPFPSCIYSAFRAPTPFSDFPPVFHFISRPSGTLVRWYLLTINKTRGHYIYLIARFNIYPSFIFVDLPHIMSVVSLGNFVRCKFRHLHTFLFISSIKVSSWSDFSTLLRFLSEIIPRCSIYFFVLTNFILTKHPSYPLLHLSRIRSLFIHIPWSCRLELKSFYFSHSSRLFSTLLSLLVSFQSRFVHRRFPSPFAPLFPYFSNLPEIVFFLGRDRL